MGVRRAAWICLVCLSGVAGAHPVKSGETFSEIRPTEVVNAQRVAVLAPPVIPLQWVDTQSSPERSVWSMAFDTMNFNLTTNTPYSGVYGQSRGFFRFSNQYKNPVFGVDVQRLAPGSLGLSATRFVTDIVWNPGGTYERSGSGRLAMAVVLATRFGSRDDSPSSFSFLGGYLPNAAVFGLVLDFGVQNHGWRTYQVDLSGTGLSLPLPSSASVANPAFVQVAIGTINANNQFVMCPQSWCMQPTLDTMSAPNDPNYPGVNPSQSGPLQWDDDGGSVVAPIFNGRHDNLTTTANSFTELYSYDWSGAVGGFPQAAVGLFLKPASGRLSGQVELPAPETLPVTLFAATPSGTLIPAPGGGFAERSVVVSVGDDGSFSVADPVIPISGGGQATTVIGAFGGGNGSLRTVSPPFSIDTGAPIPPVQVPRGDVDSSGEVDAADIDAVITRFGAIFGDPLWNPATDLDQSDEVDAADIDIVIAHFGNTSDPLPNLP